MSDEAPIQIVMSDEGASLSLASWAELDRWIDAELSAWQWLRPEIDTTNIFGVGTHVQSHLSSIRNSSRNYQANGHGLDAIRAEMGSMFNGARGPILPSTSEIGQSVLDVRELAGDDGAAAAYAFIINKLDFANIRNQNQLLGVLLSIFPAFEQSSALAQRLKSERANTKASASNLMAELRSNDTGRDNEWRKMSKLALTIGKRALRRGRSIWESQQKALGQQQLDAIYAIRAVQRAFEETMQLQAPVKYWRDKADNHKIAEDNARRRLYWFFPLSALILALTFAIAAYFLLKATANPALYIVVSGGLAIISTLGLWIGRILTKLYLSEHHLRNDAEERAVMTTTYLALTRENAATETDRHIVLNALFRSTPDGIVKDDGPGDFNIAALLSRFGVR